MSTEDKTAYMKQAFAKQLVNNYLFKEILADWEAAQYNLWLTEADKDRREQIWATVKAVRQFVCMLEQMSIDIKEITHAR